MQHEASQQLIIRHLGERPYEPVWREMQQITDNRNPESPDQIWLLQHPAVFTLGQAGRAEHILNPGDIPIIQCDRGGQVTYHGPGQLVVYLMIDLKRAGLGVRQMVSLMESAVIALLADYQIRAHAEPKAPGVYVADRKIAALGLRVRRGCSYHGLSLNVAMDMEPFQRINPCGYPGLKVTQLSDQGVSDEPELVGEKLLSHITGQLHYNSE